MQDVMEIRNRQHPRPDARYRELIRLEARSPDESRELAAYDVPNEQIERDEQAVAQVLRAEREIVPDADRQRLINERAAAFSDARLQIVELAADAFSKLGYSGAARMAQLVFDRLGWGAFAERLRAIRRAPEEMLDPNDWVETKNRNLAIKVNEIKAQHPDAFGPE